MYYKVVDNRKILYNYLSYSVDPRMFNMNFFNVSICKFLYYKEYTSDINLYDKLKIEYSKVLKSCYNCGLFCYDTKTIPCCGIILCNSCQNFWMFVNDFVCLHCENHNFIPRKTLAVLKNEGDIVEKEFFKYIEYILQNNSFEIYGINNFELRVFLFNISPFLEKNGLEVDYIFNKKINMHFNMFGICVGFKIYYKSGGFIISELAILSNKSNYSSRNKTIMHMIMDGYYCSEWFCKDHSQVIKQIVYLKNNIHTQKCKYIKSSSKEKEKMKEMAEGRKRFNCSIMYWSV